MKKIIILGICAMPFFFTSCGGGEATDGETGTDSTAMEVTEEVETIVTTYMVDTVETVINWNNFSEGEVDHSGTVNALSGTVEVSATGEEMVITSAALAVDMNTISEGSEKLVGHLLSPDFFDVNQFASTDFSFDRHENEMVYGTVTIIGKEVPVEAPVTLSADNSVVTVEVGEFKLDFASLEMPFFVSEVDAPEEEKHDSNIGFSATIVAK